VRIPLAQVIYDLFGRISAAARAVNDQIELIALELVLGGHEALNVIDPDAVLRLHGIKDDVALSMLSQLPQKFPALGVKRIAPNSELLLDLSLNTTSVVHSQYRSS
jgi:hypothetical protein